MTGTILSIVGIIAGAILSYCISYLFYKKSIKGAKLTPYHHFSTDFFSTIKNKANGKIKISYNNTEIDNFFQTQFIIINNGEKPIKNIIKPLELKIPKVMQILDVNIDYVQPEDREISCVKNLKENKITFPFLLLNPKEYFIVNIFYKSNSPIKNSGLDFKFKITSEDLPTELHIENLPENHITSLSETKDYASGLISLSSFIFSAASAISLSVFSETNPSLFIFNIKNFFIDFNYNSAFILIAWLGVLFLLFLSIILGYVFIDSFNKNKIIPLRKINNPLDTF